METVLVGPAAAELQRAERLEDVQRIIRSSARWLLQDAEVPLLTELAAVADEGLSRFSALLPQV